MKPHIFPWFLQTPRNNESMSPMRNSTLGLINHNLNGCGLNVNENMKLNHVSVNRNGLFKLSGINQLECLRLHYCFKFTINLCYHFSFWETFTWNEAFPWWLSRLQFYLVIHDFWIEAIKLNVFWNIFLPFPSAENNGHVHIY